MSEVSRRYCRKFLENIRNLNVCASKMQKGVQTAENFKSVANVKHMKNVENSKNL